MKFTKIIHKSLNSIRKYGRSQIPSYRALVFLATTVTGFAALLAQVVWQRQLAILVGSEAKSLSLTVAIFLFGLASGYFVFGKITEKKWDRFFLLKIYGYTELLTALYIGSFPVYFHLLRDLSFQSPAHLFSDILIAFLALFLPTFLMGASIPVLTAVLPEKTSEVSSIHTRIYGWNTLGACIGALVAGFYLVPQWGFNLTLAAAAWINLLAALIFIGNKLNGSVSYKPDSFVSLPSLTPNKAYMVFVFFTGAVVISFEILFVRILNVSIGAGVYNFPMVLSLFVGSLALGSLSIKNHKITTSFFIRQVFINVFLMGLIYMTAPYWSIWFSHIRVSLSNISSNYYVFKLATYLFLAFFIVPTVFFMGRLLPLAYALLKKTKENYGSVCGFLYFFNTLGTAFGTIVIGYLAFYIFDLDDLFKINLFILISLIFVISFFERERLSMAGAIFLAFLLILLPDWNRQGHYLGYFRVRSKTGWHFQKLFHLPEYGPRKLLYFKDGPNSTVSFLTRKSKKDETENSSLNSKKESAPLSSQNATPLLSEKSTNKEAGSWEQGFESWAKAETSNYSIAVNGKSDGDTKGDFSTVILLGSLPYLFSPAKENLSSAIIGLGTGITAGAMGLMKDIKETTVLEISPKVIKGIQYVSNLGYYNFQVTSNPKVKIVQRDAFKYFARTKTRFDIIVSEPSNPWVMGVENLFSQEFYRMISKSLTTGGILSQWLHTYSMNENALGMIIKTLKTEFQYAQIYKIHGGDIVILASHSPLTFNHPERFNEPLIKTTHKAIGLFDFNDILLLQIFGAKRLTAISKWLPVGLHTLHMPKLTYQADRAFFLGQSVDTLKLSPDYFTEDQKIEAQKEKALETYTLLAKKDIMGKCEHPLHYEFYCRFLLQVVEHKQKFKDKNRSVLGRLVNYNFLRKRGLLQHQKSFLKQLKNTVLKEKIKDTRTLTSYINHLLSQKEFQKAISDIELFKEKDLLPNKNSYEFIKKHIQEAQKLQNFY